VTFAAAVEICCKLYSLQLQLSKAVLAERGTLPECEIFAANMLMVLLILMKRHL
jgi:hypothetical protein